MTKRGRKKNRYDPNRTQLALMVIEALAINRCDIKKHLTKYGCFPCKIYSVAHSASIRCKHPEWWKETKELYREMAR